MSDVQAYYRAGESYILWDLYPVDVMHDLVSKAEELFAEGWVTNPAYTVQQENEESAEDSSLTLLRDAAKERGIRGWHLMGEEKLRAALGLDEDQADGDSDEG